MDARFDDSEWPLVAVRWQGALGAEERSSFLACMDAWLARGERFGLLIDSRGGSGIAPEQRAELVAHMKRQAPLTSRYLIQAVVFDNLMQRSLYYAIHLIFPNPFPSKVFADVGAARSWLSSLLAESRSASGM